MEVLGQLRELKEWFYMQRHCPLTDSNTPWNVVYEHDLNILALSRTFKFISSSLLIVADNAKVSFPFFCCLNSNVCFSHLLWSYEGTGLYGRFRTCLAIEGAGWKISRRPWDAWNFAASADGGWHGDRAFAGSWVVALSFGARCHVFVILRASLLLTRACLQAHAHAPAPDHHWSFMSRLIKLDKR